MRYLLHQGLAFRGHDESEESKNKGNFRELVHTLANQNEAIRKVVLENAPKTVSGYVEIFKRNLQIILQR